jgi:hypothetical protein
LKGRADFLRGILIFKGILGCGGAAGESFRQNKKAANGRPAIFNFFSEIFFLLFGFLFPCFMASPRGFEPLLPA